MRKAAFRGRNFPQRGFDATVAKRRPLCAPARFLFSCYGYGSNVNVIDTRTLLVATHIRVGMAAERERAAKRACGPSSVLIADAKAHEENLHKWRGTLSLATQSHAWLSELTGAEVERRSSAEIVTSRPHPPPSVQRLRSRWSCEGRPPLPDCIVLWHPQTVRQCPVWLQGA